MGTYTYSPSHTKHDAHETGAGDTYFDLSTIALTASDRIGGAWFDATANLADLAGADIESAYFHYYPTNSSADSPNVRIYAQAADTPAVFEFVVNNISDRPTTTAYATDTGTDVGASLRSIDITAVIQEIVDRPGWTGPVALLLYAQSGCNVRVPTYDSGSDIWSVEITYAEPSSGGTTVRHYLATMRNAQ